MHKMKHVRLKENFTYYRTGTIFAVVKHRGVWAAGVNQTLPCWVSDGMWIGPFEVGMERSKYAEYCITESGYRDNAELFEDYDPEFTQISKISQ